MHARGGGESHGRDHARGPGRSDHPARMQDVGEDAARPGEHAGERVCDRPEDEPPRRELGEVGQQRGDEVAEVQLAGLHELAHRVLGRLECADEALADVTADVAGLAGVVGERCGDGLPAGDGGLGRGLRYRSSSSGRSTCTRGGASGIAERRLQPLGRAGGLGQYIGTGFVGTPHRIAQRLPAFEGRASALGEIARGAAVDIRGLERPVRRLGQTEVGRAERVVLEGPVERRLRGRRRGRRRALEAVLDLAEVEVGHKRDAPLGPEGFQPLVDATDEAVDARDHTVQHRLHAVDQAVRRLERQIADCGGQQAPYRLDRLVGALERVRRRVAEAHHALDGALHSGGGVRLQVEEHRRCRGPGRSGAHADPLPNLDGHVLQERHRLAEPTRTGDEPGELIDEIARADDQRPDAGADQRPTQDDQRRGEAAHGERSSGHARDPATGEKGGEGGGIGGQAADVVEEAADRDAERAGAAGDRRHGIRDGFQRGGCSDCELVRQPAPDQPEPGDGIVRPLDLVGVLLGDHDAKGEDKRTWSATLSKTSRSPLRSPRVGVAVTPKTRASGLASRTRSMIRR